MPRSSSKSSQSGSGSSLPNATSNSDGNLNSQSSSQPSYNPQRFQVQPPTAPQGKPNAAKIESIKSYYYQLSTSLRSITAQLQQPDLTPGRRQALGLQQEKLQSSLNEFTEKVLKPLMAAARSGTPPAHIDSGLQFISGGQSLQSTGIPAQSATQPPFHPHPQNPQPVHSQGKQFPVTAHAQSMGPQGVNKTGSRHLALANQHFHEAQQQQLAFQQRLQARANVVTAASSSYYNSYQNAGSRPQSPYIQRPPNAAYNYSVSPGMSHLSRATSLQRVSLSQADLQMPPMGLVSNDTSTSPINDPDMMSNVMEVKVKPPTKISELFPDWSKEMQSACLESMDELIDKIAEQAVQYCLHQGTDVMSEREIALAIEDVLGSEYKLPKYANPYPLASIVKRPTQANNTHNARMAQIRKDMASLSTKSRQ